MPLIDLDLFRIPGFRRGVLVATLFYFTSAFYLLFAIYQQEGRGMDALATGIAILPYGVGLFLGPLASTPLPLRVRPYLLGIGMTIEVLGYASIMVAGFVLLAGRPLSAMIFVTGFGQGIAMPRLFNTVLGEVPHGAGGTGVGVRQFHPCRPGRRSAWRRSAACSSRCWATARARPRMATHSAGRWWRRWRR